MFNLKNLLRKWDASLKKISAGGHHQGNDPPVLSDLETMNLTLSIIFRFSQNEN